MNSNVKLIIGDIQLSLKTFSLVAQRERRDLYGGTAQEQRIVGLMIGDSALALTLMRSVFLRCQSDPAAMLQAWQKTSLSSSTFLKTSQQDEAAELECSSLLLHTRGSEVLEQVGCLKASTHRLLDLLATCRSIRSTDPRDNIYALLGLPDDAQDAPSPDYSRPVEQVYFDYALYFESRGLGLEVLRAAAEHPHPTISWLPDWSPVGTGQAAESFRYAAEFADYGAGGNLNTFVQIDSEARSCTVNGFIIDSITTIEGFGYSDQLRSCMVDRVFIDPITAAERFVDRVPCI